MATSVDGASDPSAPQQVFIGAAHGSLECGGRHVMIGHFLGTPIGGSEAFIDDRLGRRLTTRQLLGQYPERLGDAIVVDHPKVNPPGYPPGAIVIGLDLPGELTRDKLKVAVSAGLVCYAIRVLEAQPASGDAGPPELLEVAAVPIGTNGVGAISVEGCVSAMVDGVTMANEAIHACLFRGRRAWDCVRIAGLEIIEVLSDKAERAAHAVRRARDLAQVDVAGHSELVLGDHLMAREGGLPAALSGPDQAGDWQRIIIRNPRREGGSATPGDTTSVLEFTAIGRRARSDALQVTLD
ncbi:MAG: hypothetical protein ACRDY5_02090, partial [Acidimicrobiales bacterium]